MNEPNASRARVIQAAIAPAASADEAPMRAALVAARRALAAGEPPIGACVVQDGRVIATAHTAVAGGPDATAHAEILAIREACRHLRASTLDACQLYTTVEPCPMCLAACHYAGVGQVFFGAALADLHGITGRELEAAVPAGLTVTGGVLAAECRALLADWAAMPRPGRRPAP